MNTCLPPSTSCLPKHKKYAAAYRPGEVFWGFGVEHETYLESAVFQDVSSADLAAYRRPERYSVNYYKNYKEADLVAALSRLPAVVREVPTLMNSHSFTYCDTWMNHRTTYERVPRPNPLYGGRSVHEDFMAASPWFREAYDRSVMYDGDTFEFMNVDFYNVSVEEALEELWETEDRFMWEFNRWIMGQARQADSVEGISTIGNEACKGRMTAITNGMSNIGNEIVMNPLNGSQHLSSYGPFCLARRNHAWARHLTNPYHYSMFNNGTVHVNLTLPTQLDASGQIADADDFRLRHQKAARYFQWFEPLLAVAYGSPDPFACLGNNSYSASPDLHYRSERRERHLCESLDEHYRSERRERHLCESLDEHYRSERRDCSGQFSPTSQRLAVSRYIGMCNYPTAAMPEGKILTYDIHSADDKKTWYAEFYKRTSYVSLESRGLDINYKKHWNHGLEFRIFDGLRRDQMLEACRFVWRICYRSQELTSDVLDIADVCNSETGICWFQDLVLGCMLEGADYVITWDVLEKYLDAIHYRNVTFMWPTKDGVGIRVGELIAHIFAM